MNRVYTVVCLMFVSFFTPLYAFADTQEFTNDVPELYLQSVRVKGDEFVMLQSLSTDTIDLSNYKLQYFNHFDVSKATTSKLISVSNALLSAGGTMMISDQPVYACQSMLVSSESLSFTDGNGFLQLVSQTQSYQGAPVSFTVADSFAWSSKSSDVTKNIQLAIADASHFFWRSIYEDEEQTNYLPFKEWSWGEAKQSANNVCDVEVVQKSNDSDEIQSPVLAPLTRNPTSQPPVTISSVSQQATVSSSAGTSNAKPAYPVRSIGLEAPQISELLPNPGSPKTDADDEFIELYNGNDAVFELSGFVLRYGVNSVKEYTFPLGTLVEPKSFIAIFSADANFTLTNSKGRVELVDPYGNVIGSSEAYTNAKDDQSWALANGTWQWSTTPTPGIANTITEPASKVKAAATSKSKTVSATTGAGSGTNGGGAGNTIAPGSLTEVDQQDTLHPLVLAVIASLTVGYALYEYRQDIANKIDQFRRNRAHRRENRPSAAGR